MEAASTPPVTAPFRARARILALLGDQLIGSDQLAVFELVKNAYDADASKVTVRLLDVDSPDPVIRVVDDGDGMSIDTIRDIWLEPASNHREEQREQGRRSEIFNRLPLGEKGVGRFAVHKLGLRIRLVTRPRGRGEEHTVSIDWDDLMRVRYLDETRIEIKTRTPRFFLESKGRKPHGTRIEISRLRKPQWRRGEARQLYRSITAISSPFETSDAFKAELQIPDHPEWIAEMPDVRALLEMAPWRFDFTFDGAFEWNYQFRSPVPKRLASRSVGEKRDQLLLESPPGSRKRPVATEEMLKGIGPIKGSLVAYDRDRKILALLPQNSLVRDFLDHQGGVRVYRDGVRVYNYGEPSDDWLRLDIRRVNRPSQRLSRNIVIGAVNLDVGQSAGLREKTNREGFDETSVYEQFQELVTAILHKFEVERSLDKDRLKKLLDGGQTSSAAVPVEGPLRELREAVAANAGTGTLVPIIDRIEREYREMRDLLLRAGMSGLNLAIIIHEVERGVRSIHEAVRGGAGTVVLEERSRGLVSLVESVGGLLREKNRGTVDIRALVQETAEINKRRFARHQVHVTYDLPGAEPFVVKGSSALLQNVLVNLVDNAIYWLRVRWPDVGTDEARVRRIHIAVTDDLPGGKALLVADNGPGFEDIQEVLTKPFFTRRPGGMGLGLYYGSLAMSLSGGALIFPEHGDVELPSGMDGAVIAMQFTDPKA
ncbi:ATP-binding protein [Methylobacterium mesophilicum]|uniref:ATP-binding protein n=1 Tax=Methylobacterium mesophilicum TaxID=39956 RepID=UPI002F2E6398